MDNHIFILSRIRERWAATANHRDAIVGGIATSAGVITSAAVIDATVVRGILLPAAMTLLGARTWSLPPGLHRLPGTRPPTGPDQ